MLLVSVEEPGVLGVVSPIPVEHVLAGKPLTNIELDGRLIELVYPRSASTSLGSWTDGLEPTAHTSRSGWSSPAPLIGGSLRLRDRRHDEEIPDGFELLSGRSEAQDRDILTG